MERFDRYSLPPTAAEIRRAEQARIDEISKYRLAQRNRAKKISEPSDGGKLFVSSAKGIPSRRRNGLDFGNSARQEVEIDLSLTDADIAAERAKGPAGRYVVNASGYEEIVADDALVVHSSLAEAPPIDPAVFEERDRLLAENEKLRTELIALRDAAISRETGKPPAKVMPSEPPGEKTAADPDDVTTQPIGKPGKTDDKGKTTKP